MALNKKASIDVDALRKKINGESSFISGVMNKVPTLSWQGESDSSEEEDEAITNTIDEDLELDKGESSQAQGSKTLDGTKETGVKSMSSKKFPRSKFEVQKKVKDELKYSKQPKPPEQVKVGFSSEGKMVFSKFDFSEMGSYVEEKKKKKECNDPRRILEKLKERHELLQKLKSEGNEEKALKLKEKDDWNKAFSKVQGLKVRDDPEILKETIYKQDLRKSKHKKIWENREEKVKKAIEYKVIKRETNIKAKRDLKLKHRLKKALKKGRVIPGFS